MNQKEQKIIKEITKERVEEAKKKHGDISSYHEGFALLKEEYEEMIEELNLFIDFYNIFWGNCKLDSIDINNINYMIIHMNDLLDESMDILTVLKRIKELYKKNDIKNTNLAKC